MRLPDWILFASDATVYGLWGGGFLLLSAFSAWGERRRAKRQDVDDVGIMPWRDIGALSGFIGLALMSFAAVGWLAGG
ncbi:hypothetical protein OZN62_04135 [Aurantiacibacter sp. MUD11]|uniref:hypothetical protein n=1 Tax=Aurantiacibacter sp. MUD11 TaxID=3003265 RepID=UPI0022AAF690|nr:hypothetical protein [Aurantiacibacter sp. MUD11]WAT18766.1 hypothetical protein OZN62_04135 [Aurantiacibacter sp. MUD11]